jgi:putative membrane protein
MKKTTGIIFSMAALLAFTGGGRLFAEPATDAGSLMDTGVKVSSPGGPSAAQSSSMASTQEVKLLMDIHHDNQMEIQAGQMAKENGASDAVKQFGQRLIDDHTKADQKVQELASQQGISLDETAAAPATSGGQKVMDMKEDMAAMDSLKTVKGAEFDKKFAQAMLKDHRQTIQKLETKRASLPQASPVRKLIGEILPDLRQHRKIAQQLAQGGTSAKPAASQTQSPS